MHSGCSFRQVVLEISRSKMVLMNRCPEASSSATSNLRQDSPLVTDEPGHLSRELCEVMLDVLGRDNHLRRTYVRRRWQGRLD